MGNDNIALFSSRSRATGGGAGDKGGGGHHTGGSDGGGSDLEKRLEKLETTVADVQIRLIRIEAKFEALDDKMATKADLHDLAASFHKSMNEQTWKFLGGATGLAAVFSAIAFGLARALS